jgi:hypothetical protein
MFKAVSQVAVLLSEPWRDPMRAAVLCLIALAAIGAARIVEAAEWQFIGSRYQAMGGAGIAMADESLALYWNPGALAFAKGHDVQLPFGVSVSAEGDVMRSSRRSASGEP